MASTIPNLRHLRVFCEVVDCGGVSAASEIVHLSQPAVTQAVAKLETSLDLALFVRSGGGMRPTVPGAIFRERAGRALALIHDGVDLARRGGRQPRQPARDLDRLVTATQLRALLALAKHDNFSLAARRSGVSQPALHRAARDLERVMGVPLFHATPLGVVLTDGAERLARFANLALSELRQAHEELDAWRGVDRARIVVGTLPLARSHVLPAALNALSRLRPEIRVSVIDGPYDDLLHGLRHGEIDVMIGALRDPPPIDDVVQEALFHDRLVIIARAGHPLAKRDAVSIAELAEYPWVAPRLGAPTRAYFDRFFAEAGVPTPARLIESSSLVLVRALLQGGDRLTMISAHQVRDDEAAGRVRRMAVHVGDPPRPIGATMRRGWSPTRTQSLFLDLLREASASLA